MTSLFLRGAISLCISASIGALIWCLNEQGDKTAMLTSLGVGMGGWGGIEALRSLVGRWRWWSKGLGPFWGPTQQTKDGEFRFWPGWLWMMPCMLVGAAIGSYLGLGLASMLAHGLGWSTHVTSWVPQSDAMALSWLISMVGTTVVALAISAGFFLRERLAWAQREAESAKALATEAQLKMLQAQLEPHMLFNTLANLRVLIGLDAQQAQHMLDQLIRFLRATLQASRMASHSLAREFEQIEDYLHLMQVRMGPRLRVHLNLPQQFADAQVPPLLLQPLVENAIKHGLEPKLEGGDLWVDVCSRRGGEMSSDELVICVRDSGLGLNSMATGLPGEGFGLKQVQARLDALWGRTADMSVQSPAIGGFEVTMTLPYKASVA